MSASSYRQTPPYLPTQTSARELFCTFNTSLFPTLASSYASRLHPHYYLPRAYVCFLVLWTLTMTIVVSLQCQPPKVWDLSGECFNLVHHP
ncbi:hypothetical protein VN97_g6094 [Penicillium thymicola]|uniref:Uncharacterized protein n=1 Tax=Penicillium thymicola TaxID=293382 RepID=A0AAI9X7Z5_PENTH|nr:hypothetical protein VN97_g6094 [Penicillium thymicola]